MKHKLSNIPPKLWENAEAGVHSRTVDVQIKFTSASKNQKKKKKTQIHSRYSTSEEQGLDL